LQQGGKRLAQDHVIVGDHDANPVLRHLESLDAQRSRAGMRYSG
jgi:hypothetical protein